MDASKPLCSSFKISKRSKDEEIPIAQFPLVKKVTGIYICDTQQLATYDNVYMYVCITT